MKEVLDYTLSEYDNFEFVQSDALKIDFKKLIKEKFTQKKIVVVANLPYYVTTPIITRLLESDLVLESITIMVQKEVAQRLVASTPIFGPEELDVPLDYESVRATL